MSIEKPAYRRLDKLLSGLEQNILRLDDREVISESKQLFGSGRHVREILDANLQYPIPVKETLPNQGVARVHGRPKAIAHKIPVMQVPSSLSGKRQLLEQLVASTSGISGEIRMAFSAPQSLSDSEVEVMVERLVRLGVLRRKQTNKDDK